MNGHNNLFYLSVLVMNSFLKFAKFYHETMSPFLVMVTLYNSTYSAITLRYVGKGSSSNN